jgi:hypothetical protein
MFWTIIELGLLAISLYGAYALKPKAGAEQAKRTDLDHFGLPRASEGDPIPLIYGRVRVRSPNVISFGDVSYAPVSHDGQTIGSQVILSIRMVLGLSNAEPGDSAASDASFLGWFIGDALATNTLLEDELDGYQTYGVTENEILGGNEPGGQGIISGTLRFYGGSFGQERPSTETIGDEVGATTPYHRGQIVAYFGGIFGMAASLPPISFIVFNPCRIPGYESSSGPIGEGDVNPAAVIYDVLTNPWGRLGNSRNLVDTASFAAAAATLEDEQHGISLLITAANDARSVIEQVLRQIDAVLYQDPVTGLYVLNLIREDYDVGDLPMFDPSNAGINGAAPELQSPLWEEAVNEVRVIYTSPEYGFVDSTALAHDMAVINAQGGRRRSAEYRFPGVTDKALAYRLAARELNFLSRPFLKLRVTVNRDGYDLRPGDAFRFVWPEWDLDTVFRVVEMSAGTHEDGTITIDAVQDRFAVSGSVFDPPGDEIGPSAYVADPIITRHVTEAPRWVQLQAFNAGAINSADVQRSYALALPEGADSLYKVRVGVDGADTETDLGPLPFHGHALVDLAYARTAEPYDTSTGLRIRAVSGVTLAGATSAEIALGANLICVGSGDTAEFMAFETVTDLGGGDYLLEDVWRGLLDTAPVAHDDAEPVWFVDARHNMLGGSGLIYGDAIVARTQGGAGVSWVGEPNSPYDDFTVRMRTLLSFPGSDLKLGGSQDGSLTKTPSAHQEGGISVDWKIRDRTSATLVRGDTADASLGSGETFAVVATKGSRARVDCVTGLTASTASLVHLGGAGHGTIAVGVETRRAVTMPDATTPTVGSWTVPELDIVARHWRNLLVNQRFASGTGTGSGWTTTTGTPSTSTSGSLGAGGDAALVDIGTSGLGISVYQDVPVQGYDAMGLTAVLDWYEINPDADDTITVTVQSLDSGGSVLQTSTYGPTVPANEWRHQTLELAGLHASTRTVRVRIVYTAVGELDDTAGIKVTECILRVGQLTAQLLNEPSFEGGTTGWTTVSGTWAQLTPSVPYSSLNAFGCTANVASAEAYQQVTVTTGFERAAVAVLEFAISNTAADDSGETILEARDGGGSVLTSATTGAIVTTAGVWDRQRVTLELPVGTASLRVRLVGTRNSASGIDVIWDDFDLRIHAHLDPDEEIEIDFGTPATQALPRTAEEWRFLIPGVDEPDYAIFDGGLVGRLGREPLMQVDDGILASATAVVRQPAADGTIVATTTCYEGSRQATADVHTSPIGTAFANFTSAGSFTALVFLKTSEIPWSSAACGLVGRVVDGVGWSLGLDASGNVRARLFGADGTATASVTPDVDVIGGGVHAVAIAYNAATDLVYVVTAYNTASASTAAIGEFEAGAGRFRILRADDVEAAFPGQILRVYLWAAFVPVVDLQSLMFYGGDETGRIATHTRDGSIAVVSEQNDDGVLVETFGPGQTAIALHTSSNRHYLVAAPVVTNLAPATFDDADWTTVGAATVTHAAAIDPTGYKRAATITSEWDEGLQLNNVALGAAGDVTIAWFARADVAHDAAVSIYNASGAGKDLVSYAVTPTWQLFTWTSGSWDGTSAGVGAILFSGNDNAGAAETVQISPLILVAKDGYWRGVIPYGAPSATTYDVVPSLTSLINNAGELEVELWNADVDGTIADLSNGSDSNDRRRLWWDADGGGADVVLDHYTSAAANTTATQANTTIDPAEPWKARGRWNRALVPDAATPTGYSLIRVEQGATVEDTDGRVATWTASTTAPDLLRLGHDGSTSILSGGIFGVRISARERKVAG